LKVAYVTNLADTYQKAGKYEKAVALLDNAEKSFTDEVDKKKITEKRAYIANQEGLKELEAAHYARAKKLFERALAIDEKHFGKEHPTVAIRVNNLAGVYYKLGDYARAKSMFERELAIAEQFNIPETLLRSHYFLGKTLEKLNLPAPAVFFGKQAVNTIQKMRAGIMKMEDSLQKSFVTKKKHVYNNLADLLIDLGRLPEARQVLAMLKQEEYFDFIRRDAGKQDIRSTTADFNTAEKPWAEKYAKINIKLAAFGREYAELKKKKKSAGLSDSEKARFK